MQIPIRHLRQMLPPTRGRCPAPGRCFLCPVLTTTAYIRLKCPAYRKESTSQYICDNMSVKYWKSNVDAVTLPSEIFKIASIKRETDVNRNFSSCERCLGKTAAPTCRSLEIGTPACDPACGAQTCRSVRLHSALA